MKGEGPVQGGSNHYYDVTYPVFCVATAVPIYMHSPYRDHLPNFGPYSDNFTLQAMKLSTPHIMSKMFYNSFKCFIQSILHDLKQRAHKKVTLLSDLALNLSP
jgi:hypothetical protein